LEVGCNISIRNTFQIPAKARTLITYGREDVEELVTYLQHEGRGQKVLHVGSGSNLLFMGDYEGIVLYSDIREISTCGEYVRAGAAWVMDDLIAWTLHNGLHGLENLSLIPGTVGAAAVQNIGAYGSEVSEYICEVETLELRTGCIRIWKPEELEYGYRKSVFKKPDMWGRYAVLSVTFKLSRTFVPELGYGGLHNKVGTDNPTAEQVRQAVIDIRREKLPDPEMLGNAGSFFVNPVVRKEKADALKDQYPEMPYYVVENGVKIPAGWMIEQCGWKGRSLGPAAVHDRQALVLVNRGGATGEDIARLSDAVCKAVWDKFGVEIRPEVNFI